MGTVPSFKVTHVSSQQERTSAFGRHFARSSWHPSCEIISMRRRRLDAKRDRAAHVDQEKSLVDVFEHVIRGVRLNRLRDLLRESEKQRNTRAISLEWAPES
jgi:hypothetical protein